MNNSDFELDSTKVTNFWMNNSKMASIYPSRSGKGEYPENPEVFEVIKDLTQDRSVIEYGCGYGRLSPFFKDCTYLGVDINKHAIKLAKITYPAKKFEHIHNSTLLPKVDIVFAYTVFHHIPLDVLPNVFNQIARSAKQLIIMEIMNADNSNPSRMPPCVYRTSETYITMSGFKLEREGTVIYGPYANRLITYLILDVDS